MNSPQTWSTSGHARYWIRVDAILRPFFWGGFLPLLGLLLITLYALGPFAREEIEQQVARETQTTLVGHGHGWARVSVSGQDVRLSGVEPSRGEGDRAFSLARAATCPSWAGRLVCPIDVQGQFSAAAPPILPAPPAPAISAQAVATCEKSLADIVGSTRIEFATASAELRPSSLAILDLLARAAQECPGIIQVEGHTDSRGGALQNKTLSDARAESVRRALVQRGVAEARLQSRGFGADKPIGDNATAAGREANRRIEFHVIASK